MIIVRSLISAWIASVSANVTVESGHSDEWMENNGIILAWLEVVKVDGVDSASEHARVEWDALPPGLELELVGLVDDFLVVLVDLMFFLAPLLVLDHLVHLVSVSVEWLLDAWNVALGEGWLVKLDGFLPCLVTLVLVSLDVLVHGMVDIFHEVVAWGEASEDGVSLVHCLVRDAVEPSSKELSWCLWVSSWCSELLVVWALDKTHALSNVSVVHTSVEVDALAPLLEHFTAERVDFSLVLGVSLVEVIVNVRSGHDVLGVLVEVLELIEDLVCVASLEGGLPVGFGVFPELLGVLNLALAVGIDNLLEHVVEVGVVGEAGDDFVSLVFLLDGPEVTSVELSSSVFWEGGSSTLEKVGEHN